MKKNKELERPPIVCVLGHVDHGKTTLLDVVRKTNFRGKEVGGITQSIGASVIDTGNFGVSKKEGNKITFIDTPGHEAFEKMRLRGAIAADLALLLVAADDGVKPQTIEALGHIRKAGIPFIVVITKIDLPSSNIETVKGELEKENVLLEGRGGDVPLVSVSAKEKKGIDNLLEMIILVSEVKGIKGDKDVPLEAVVIESLKSKAGPMVSVVVKNGTLEVGKQIVTQGRGAKVKALFDDRGSRVERVIPGFPAGILGFGKLPPVGSIVSEMKENSVIKKGEVSSSKRNLKQIREDQIAVVVKAKTNGALEAVVSGLSDEAYVVQASVGDVTENDVLMAKSANAYLFAFESKIPMKVRRFAETEGIELERFNIIYKLFEKFEEIIEKGRMKIMGTANIVGTFPFNKKRVAGCKILGGEIDKGDVLKLMRKEEEVGEVKVISIRKQKLNVGKVKQGEECGILFEPQFDFDKGDVLISKRI